MILFHDVDGCLNTADGSPLAISDDTLTTQERAALRTLGERLDASAVSHLVINTGRSWASTAHLCKAIDSHKARYALTEHGAELWDFHANASIDLLELSNQPEHEHIQSALAGVDRIRELIGWFQAQGSAQICNAIDYPANIHHQAEKESNLTIPIPPSISGATLFDAVKSAIGSEPQFSDDRFVFHHSKSAGFIDVMGQMDKGMGVELVTQYLDGDLNQTAAIGDGLNDLPMLRTVSLPICPANAEPEVQALCRASGHQSEGRYIMATTTWLS